MKTAEISGCAIGTLTSRLNQVRARILVGLGKTPPFPRWYQVRSKPRLDAQRRRSVGSVALPPAELELFLQAPGQGQEALRYFFLFDLLEQHRQLKVIPHPIVAGLR